MHLHAATLWNYQAELKITPGKYPLITNAVLAKCDANDGMKDGLLNNPLSCHFAAKELACKIGAVTDSCRSARVPARVGQAYSVPRMERFGHLGALDA